jgi:hypothetical protein
LWYPEDHLIVKIPVGLVPTEPVIDIGEIEEGIIDIDVEVVNREKVPVKIVYVVKNCRCIDVDVPDDAEILSDQKAKIKCKWDTTGLHGNAGTNFVALYKKKGEEEVSHFQIDIQGVVKSQFDLVPDKLEFVSNKQESKTLRLVSRKPENCAKIISADSSLGAFAIDHISASEIVVTFFPDKWIHNAVLKPKIVVSIRSTQDVVYTVPVVFSDVARD